MSSFVTIPIETDPEQLVEDVFEQVQDQFPGWEPSEGNLETWIVRALASVIGAPLAEVAADVPAEVFRRFGEVVHGVVPLNAAHATVETTWTMVDNAGYTIPAGTQVAIPTAGDTSVGFTVLAEVQVPPGSDTTATGGVVLQAIFAGEEANGLEDDPELVDALIYVDSIVNEGTTSGGEDAEEPDEYLDRLRETLQLLSQNAILPGDVEILARSAPGVERAVALDLYYPGVDEVQQIIATGGSAGTFTLTYSGQTTASIAYNASASAVQSALEALSNIAVGDVEVTGGPLPNSAVLVTFTGALEKTNVAQMTVTDSITGGDAVVTTVTAGEAPDTNVEKTVTVAVIDENGAALTEPAKDEVKVLLAEHREVNFLFYVIDPTYTTIKVSATVTTFDGADDVGVEAAVEQAITDYLSPENWGRDPLEPDSSAWRNVESVYRNELIALVDRVEGVDHVTALTLAEEGGVLGTSDVALETPAPLPEPGTITATVA